MGLEVGRDSDLGVGPAVVPGLDRAVDRDSAPEEVPGQGLELGRDLGLEAGRDLAPEVDRGLDPCHRLRPEVLRGLGRDLLLKGQGLCLPCLGRCRLLLRSLLLRPLRLLRRGLAPVVQCRPAG